MIRLFSTEKNPQGPSIKRLEKLNIDLSSNQLLLSLPYGNESSFNNPEPYGTVVKSFNIYDSEKYGDKNELPYLLKIILERDYVYSSLMHAGLGTVMILGTVRQLDSQDVNLFYAEQLQDVLHEHLSKRFEKFNDDADENCKFFPPDNYHQLKINNLKWLSYSYKQHNINQHYSVALTQNHYLTFDFKYLTWDESAPWYIMAKKLEQQIMSTVQLELGASLQQERLAAQG